MDSKQYEPGRVAVIDTISDHDLRAVRRGGVWIYLDSEGYAIDANVTNVRPLVVLDLGALNPVLSGSEAANYAIRTLRGSGWISDSRLADQIEQQTRPPEPAQPTGLGAVVEADFETDAGRGYGPATWSLAGDGSWVCLTDGLVGTKAPWPFLTNVKVLSGGVAQ